MNTTHINEPTELSAKSREGKLMETISLRDYFAIHATADDIAPFIEKWRAQATETTGSLTRLVIHDKKTTTSVARYAFADSMLKARES